jgi:DNA-binding beta-propeller fold protein YncE
VTLGGEPGFDAVTPDGHVTVVTNFANSTVVPVVTCQSGSPPTDTFAPGAAVRAGRNPTEVAILPTPVSQTATQVQWLAYVTDYGASDVRAYVLTESTSSCGASLSQVAAFPASSISANQAAVNAQPYGIAITPNGQTAYVSDYGLNAVTPINLGTGQVGNPIPVGMNPEGIAVTPDGATVYVVNSGSGTITPIATSSNLPGLPIAVGSSPTMIAITDDGARALVTNAGSDSVTDILLQSCGTTGSCASSATTSLGLASPTGVAVSADGSTAWVASCNGDDIFPISLGGSPSADAIDTAGLVQGVACPVGIAITPDQAPVAQLAQTTISTTTGAAAFDASPSTVAYGQITLYGWIFGDGTETQTSGPLATHTYSAPGTYVVTVIEVDGAGTALTSAFTGQTLSRYAALKGNGLKEDVVQAVVTVGGVTGGGGNGGGPIPITGVSGLLYTANVNAGTVTPIGLPNSGAPDVGASITVGKGPANVAVTPDGQGLVVPNFSANTVSPVSVCANTTSGTFSFTAGTAVTTTSSEPLDVAFAPSPVSTSGPTTVWNFYVTEYGGSIVEQFQLTVNSATCTAAVNRVSPYSASLIPVGQAPYGIAISPNGATAYVSNSGSATVTPISLNAGAVGGQTGAPIPVGRNPEGIAMSSSGTVVVADSGSGAVTVINTSNNTPGPPITVGSSPDYVAVTPNGSWAYVTNVGSGTVSAVNLASCTPASCQVLTIGLPSVGYGVVMSPDGTTAWVACPGAGEVVPISVATNSIASDVIAGLNGPLGVAEGAAP